MAATSVTGVGLGTGVGNHILSIQLSNIELFDKIKLIAKRKNTTVSKIVNELVDKYIKEDEQAFGLYCPNENCNY